MTKKLVEKDLTKKLLTEVAKNLSKLFEQPIKVNTKSTVASIKTDLIDAGKELLAEDESKLSDQSKEVLTLLGIKLPFKKEEKLGKTGETKKPGKPAIKKAGGKNGPGVIASILEFISKSKSITITKIHEKLTARFADRDADAMMKTIKAQIAGKKSPCRMEREKKVTFEIKDGKYSVKK